MSDEARKNAAETRKDGMPKGIPFKKGNPGRPKGARHKLGEAFLEAMHEDFSANGVEAIVKVRDEKPDQYLKVIASLLPKDINLNVNENESMTDDELIARIRELDAIVAPFLATSAESGTGAGTAASAEPTSH